MSKVRSKLADDYGPRTLDAWVDQMGASTEKTWGVYRDGELGGMLSFQRVSPWLGTAHCVFKPDFWGRAITRPAVESALREMFGSGIGKLSFAVFSDNRAIRSLLSEFGASVEGTLRKHTLRDGKPIDTVTLAIFKESFDALFGSTGTNSTGSHRGGSLNSGIDHLGNEGGADVHIHPDAIPPNAADGRSASVVLV